MLGSTDKHALPKFSRIIYEKEYHNWSVFVVKDILDLTRIATLLFRQKRQTKKTHLIHTHSTHLKSNT